MPLVEIVNDDIVFNCNPDVYFLKIYKDQMMVETNALSRNFDYSILNDMFHLNLYFVVASVYHDVIYYVGDKKIIEERRNNLELPSFSDWIFKSDIKQFNLFNVMRNI